MSRQTPRIILRTPRRGTFGAEAVLVLEMGLGGAKFEHSERLVVGIVAPFSCGPLSTDAEVRHSVLLPARTGVVYQTGVFFPNAGPREDALLMDLLVHEARQQLAEWEANVSGVTTPPPASPRRSAVAVRFVSLRLKPRGWERSITADPNQPLDGVAVPDGTSEEEIAVLRATYEQGEPATRELMRRVATVAILEALSGKQ